MQEPSLRYIPRVLSAFAVFMYTPKDETRSFLEIVETCLQKKDEVAEQYLAHLLWALALSGVRDDAGCQRGSGGEGSS